MDFTFLAFCAKDRFCIRAQKSKIENSRVRFLRGRSTKEKFCDIFSVSIRVLYWGKYLKCTLVIWRFDGEGFWKCWHRKVNLVWSDFFTVAFSKQKCWCGIIEKNCISLGVNISSPLHWRFYYKKYRFAGNNRCSVKLEEAIKYLHNFGSKIIDFMINRSRNFSSISVEVLKKYSSFDVCASSTVK